MPNIISFSKNGASQAVSSTSPLPISSGSAKASASQTRPNNTTPYDANDVVGTNPATNLSFSGVSSVQGASFLIAGATLEIDAAAVPSGMTTFRLHLYNAAPTAIADGTAFDLPAGDRAKYLGYINLAAPVDLGATLWSQNDSANFNGKLADSSTTLYGILETIGAFTPSAQTVKKVTLYILGV